MSRISEAIDCEQCDCAEESSDFKELAPLEVPLGYKAVHVCIQVRDYSDRREGSYQRPSNDCVGVITLGLDELTISFFRQLVECNFRFVFVLVFKLSSLLLPLCLILEIWIVEVVFAFRQVDLHLLGLLLDPVSYLFAFRLHLVQ